MPHLADIQRSFGRHDLSHVVAHLGPSATAAADALDASAYTISNRVAFAGSPDLRTAAHEATHAVQQRLGVHVRGDIGEVGDVYERHAEAVADHVVRGNSTETLLDQIVPSGSRSTPQALTASPDAVSSRGPHRPSTTDGPRVPACELTSVVKHNARSTAPIQRKQELHADLATDKPQIVAIVAFLGSTMAMATISDGNTNWDEPVTLKLNEYDEPGMYTLTHRANREYTSTDKKHGFKWWKKGEYDWADTVQVTILPKHIEGFLTTDRGPVASSKDLLSKLRAGQLLAEQQVTAHELQILEGRRADAEGIGGKQPETSDPVAWATEYLAARKERATTEHEKSATLYGIAKRLAQAPIELYQADDLIHDIMEPKSKLSPRLTAFYDNFRTGAHKTPFSDIYDVQDTLSAFEDALVFDLRRLANLLLDTTDVITLRIDREFIGLWQPQELSSVWVDAVISKIKKDPEIAEILHKREMNTQAQEQQRGGFPQAAFDIATTFQQDNALQKEKQELDKLLHAKIGEKSALKLSPEYDLDALLSAKGADEERNILRDILIDTRRKVRLARKSIENRQTLYHADLVIAKEKELLAEKLGAEGSRVVNAIIDKLASERRDETTVWEDIFAVLKILALFVPGPIGWGIRTTLEVVGLDKTLGEIATQEAFGVTGLGTPPPPGSASTAVLNSVVNVAVDKLMTPFAAETKAPLTLGLNQSRREASELIADLGEHSAPSVGGGGSTTPETTATTAPSAAAVAPRPPRPRPRRSIPGQECLASCGEPQWGPRTPRSRPRGHPVKAATS